MKNKKGFTLIEILAVIALIGVLLLMVVPNIVKLFTNAKQQTFYDEVLSLYDSAYTTYILRSSAGDYKKVFCVDKAGTNNNPLDIEEKENYYYKIEVDTYGEVQTMEVTNAEFSYVLEKGEKKKDIKISKITEPKTITCS